MITTRRGIFREALALVRPTLVFKQIGIAILVLLLSAVWLRIPDASAYWLALSIALGLLVIATAGAAETLLLLQLAARPRTRKRLVLGIALLLLAVVLWYVSSGILAHISVNDGLRAGYFNSRFSQRGRYIFTYEHLVLWQSWLWNALQMLIDGLIVACLLAPVAAINPARAIFRTLLSLTYWMAVFLAFFVAPFLKDKLVSWLPGHGLSVEVTSLVSRLLAAVLVCGWIACFLLAALAICVRRSNARYDTALDGTPFDNQTRTVVIP